MKKKRIQKGDIKPHRSLCSETIWYVPLMCPLNVTNLVLMLNWRFWLNIQLKVFFFFFSEGGKQKSWSRGVWRLSFLASFYWVSLLSFVVHKAWVLRRCVVLYYISQIVHAVSIHLWVICGCVWYVRLQGWQREARCSVKEFFAVPMRSLAWEAA